MSTKIGRPVEFDAARRETFCALVGVGLSRRQAADHVGIAASTATRCAERDETFADALRQAEMKFYVDLMEKLRRQSERSWRACVWLLEHSYPETYGRGKAKNRLGLTVDQLFDQFVMLLEEIPDAALRGKLTARLDRIAMAEFQPVAAAEPEAEVVAPQEVPAMASLEPVAAKPFGHCATPAAAANSTPSRQSEKRPDPRPPRPEQHSRKRRERNRPQATPIARKADLIDALLAVASGVNRPPIDFCNTSDFCITSPGAHERRLLENVSA